MDSILHIVALLEDVACGSRPQRTQNRLLRTPGRHHQDTHAECICAQLRNQLTPIAVGQVQIHQHKRHGLLRQAESARLRQRGSEQQGICRITQRAEHPMPQTVLQQRLIFHYQHGRGRDGFGGRGGHGCRQFKGATAIVGQR